jgi:hypothetical protein
MNNNQEYRVEDDILINPFNDDFDKNEDSPSKFSVENDQEFNLNKKKYSEKTQREFNNYIESMTY